MPLQRSQDTTLLPGCLQDTPLLLALAEPLLAAARAQNQLQAQRLLAACQRGSQLQVQAEAAAGKLTELYYHLSAQLGEVTAAVSVHLASHCSSRVSGFTSCGAVARSSNSSSSR